MPIATFDQYCAMLDNAKRGRFAYPAINIAGLEGLNATLEGFAEARSDGIVQVSSGGGAHATGPAVADMALGAQVLAEAVVLIRDAGRGGPTELKQQLEELIDLEDRLQQQLGHQNIQSTLRYVHWAPNTEGGNTVTDLIAALEVIYE